MRFASIGERTSLSRIVGATFLGLPLLCCCIGCDATNGTVGGGGASAAKGGTAAGGSSSGLAGSRSAGGTGAQGGSNSNGANTGGLAASTGGGGSIGGTQELADGTVGSSCGTCAADLTCVSAGVPNGYCTRACTTQADCGTAGTCVQSGSAIICYRVCQTNNDCRPGYACVSAGTVSVCDVASTTNAGTCDAACAHYLGCKGVYDVASQQVCTTSCNTMGYTPADLANFVLTDCVTAVQMVEGTSSGGTTGGSNCSGCVWDGSACTWFSSSGAALSGLVQTCDAACCPGH
jgi:hypothetical protein